MLGLYFENELIIFEIMNNILLNVLRRKKIIRLCMNVWEYIGFFDECSYVCVNIECSFGMFIEYVIVYYCMFLKVLIFVYVLFFVWFLMFFYMLGNIVVDYFCFFLEKFLELLWFFFIVFGVFFFFLGNGVFDVFFSIVLFLGMEYS